MIGPGSRRLATVHYLIHRQLYTVLDVRATFPAHVPSTPPQRVSVRYLQQNTWSAEKNARQLLAPHLRQRPLGGRIPRGFVFHRIVTGGEASHAPGRRACVARSTLAGFRAGRHRLPHRPGPQRRVGSARSRRLGPGGGGTGGGEGARRAVRRSRGPFQRSAPAGAGGCVSKMVHTRVLLRS